MSIDVRDYWDFNNPAASEITFRGLLANGGLSPDEQLDVWAQIARTFSLRDDCIRCHEILDEHWSAAMLAGGRPQASFQLERGRAYRTGKDLEDAIPYFQDAAESDVEDLKVDALHMLAIDADSETSHRIHAEALEVARNSANPWAQRWQGTLLNNMGWAYFGSDQFAEALTCFEDALAQREYFGRADQIKVAKWCVARCLRALGRLDEALAIQLALKADGGSEFVDQELAELQKATGQPGD